MRGLCPGNSLQPKEEKEETPKQLFQLHLLPHTTALNWQDPEGRVWAAAS